MFHEGLTDQPTSADHLWKMVEENFDHAKVILSLRLQTKAEALADEPFDAMFPYYVSYRGASDDNDQRKYFYDLGNAQIVPLKNLIRERSLTPEFVHRWGS